jgi:hypothetical protein
LAWRSRASSASARHAVVGVMNSSSPTSGTTRTRQGSTSGVGGVDLWLADDLDDAERPADRNRSPAVAIGVRRQVAQHMGLMGRVQARAGDQLRELVPPVWVTDLLESDHIRFQAPQLLVHQPRASGIALIMLHVDRQHP